MSDHTWSPRDGLDLSTENQLQEAIREVRRIADWHPSTPEAWDQRLQAARTTIRTFDSTGFISLPNHSIDRIFVITTLQRVAYHEVDSDGIADIAEWCVRQWLQMLQRDAQNGAVLRGLGQAWLARSQSLLARIHRREGSSSSGSSGRPQSLNERLSYTPMEEARDAERATMEADARAHTADYVEARGTLIPAVDYFARAIEALGDEGRHNGELLSEAAEANISLGNVSYSHTNEQYFHTAVRYLRLASQIPSYRLSPYLQGYLEDYGRLVE